MAGSSRDLAGRPELRDYDGGDGVAGEHAEPGVELDVTPDVGEDVLDVALPGVPGAFLAGRNGDLELELVDRVNLPRRHRNYSVPLPSEGGGSGGPSASF